MRYRLRTLLIVLALGPPAIAIYVTAILTARNVARSSEQVRRERAILDAERSAFESQRARLKATPRSVETGND